MTEAASKIEAGALPAFLKLAWAISARDLENTIKLVSKFLLKDASVPWIIRIRRSNYTSV